MLLHVALEGGQITTIDEAHILKKIYPEPKVVSVWVAEGVLPMPWHQGKQPQLLVEQ